MESANVKVCPQCFGVSGLKDKCCGNCLHKYEKMGKVCVECHINTTHYKYKLCVACHKDKLLENINDNLTCGHPLCDILRKEECYNVAYVLPLFQHKRNGICAWVGLENDGKYKDKCNLIGGHGIKNDRINDYYCWINTAIRCMDEKAKYKLDKINDSCPYIIHNKKPIFLLKFKNGNAITKCQQQIDLDNVNYNLPPHLKKLSYIGRVNITNLKHVGKIQLPISKFATDVIKKINDENLEKLDFAK